NLLEGRSADFGVAPPGYYGAVAWTAIGVALPVLLIGFAASARRATGLAVIVLVYVLLHTIIPHKEFRFMMPHAPLFLALSSVGLLSLLDVLRSPAKPAPRARASRADRRAARRSAAAPAAAAAPAWRVHAALWAVAGLLALAMSWRTARATFEDFG